jgi:hypothetical protein
MALLMTEAGERAFQDPERKRRQRVGVDSPPLVNSSGLGRNRSRG